MAKLADPNITVREALATYLADNGFTTEAYGERFSKLSFFGLPIWIVNTKGRQRGLPLHDLHHVALGYDTDLVGECEISAWELRSGVRGHGPFVFYLIAQATLLGFVLSPKRARAAWRRGAGCRSLYALRANSSELMDMRVSELRQMLGLPTIA